MRKMNQNVFWWLTLPDLQNNDTDSNIKFSQSEIWFLQKKISQGDSKVPYHPFNPYSSSFFTGVVLLKIWESQTLFPFDLGALTQSQVSILIYSTLFSFFILN